MKTTGPETRESNAASIPSWRPRGRPRPLSRLEKLLGWARSHSLGVHVLATPCCALDLDSLFGPRFDVERVGVGWPLAAPRQADLLLVVGPVTRRQAVALRRAYEEMAEPKWVMAIGGCACAGEVAPAYASAGRVEDFVPVDVHVPGCPPRAEAILDALAMLQRRIRVERIGTQGRHYEPPDRAPG